MRRAPLCGPWWATTWPCWEPSCTATWRTSRGCQFSLVMFLSQQIPEMCWIVQELANEARSMMWAMVGNNVAVLGAFLHCNLEDVNGPARVDAEHPKIFSSILVGPLALDEHSI